MKTTAIVLAGPEQLELRTLTLAEPAAGEVLVEIEHSAISTGTERLLWSGRMPAFPGMGYPLVPGYESVGRVLQVGPGVTELPVGARVFVPGANCFGDVRGLFGGAASHVIVSAARIARIDDALPESEQGVLLALAATAQHALAGGVLPDLIVGHGALGRLLARVACAAGGSPVVWENNPQRATGSTGYRVLHPDEDARRDYRSIYDVSGDSALLDPLIARLARGGELVLAGFYAAPVSFAFAPAFMREARLRIAAEWQPGDLHAVLARLRRRELSLSGLITHRMSVRDAAEAYRTAFGDPSCLKMLIDWRSGT
jgi:3-hydroxyethyl bacteriochlorophyllide a dehydrogenase